MKKLSEFTVDRRIALKDRRENERRETDIPSNKHQRRRKILLSSGIVDVDRRMRTRRKEDRTPSTDYW